MLSSLRVIEQMELPSHWLYGYVVGQSSRQNVRGYSLNLAALVTAMVLPTYSTLSTFHRCLVVTWLISLHLLALSST